MQYDSHLFGVGPAFESQRNHRKEEIGYGVSVWVFSFFCILPFLFVSQ